MIAKRLSKGRGNPLRRCAGALAFAAAGVVPFEVEAGSIDFDATFNNGQEYGLQTQLPTGFGSGEFTFELWIKPNTNYSVGPIEDNTLSQLLNWAQTDNQPYSGFGWWFRGNFLVDGHNNDNFSAGTFSLQFYGGGRLRWSFGDGVSVPGGHWSVQAYPASSTPSLLDGEWHNVNCVRRWDGGSGAILELWIDGQLIATETTPARTNMALAYWANWSAFPSGQAGWFYGAEKQAAIGIIPMYEDFKGLVDEIRFWNRAKTIQELQTEWSNAADPFAPGLSGLYNFGEGGGSQTCSPLADFNCIYFFRTNAGHWSAEEAPAGTTVNPSLVYVDFDAPGGGDGSQQAPFNSLAAGVNSATVGATIEISTGAAPETITVSKPLTLRHGGTESEMVRIGVAPASRAREVERNHEGFVSP